MRIKLLAFWSLTIAGSALAQTKPLLDYTFPPKEYWNRPAKPPSGYLTRDIKVRPVAPLPAAKSGPCSVPLVEYDKTNADYASRTVPPLSAQGFIRKIDPPAPPCSSKGDK